MKTCEPSAAAATAERAYFFYLERQKRGLPGDEHSDWIRAEAAVLRPEFPLTEIKGIGPRVASQLNDCGITTATQLASWTLTDIAERLPRLLARAKSGKWLEQARELS